MDKPKPQSPHEEADEGRAGKPDTPPTGKEREGTLHDLLKLMIDRHEIPAHRVDQLTKLL